MKLSIITINYKNLKGLQATANSVISQTNKDFEWIIIDGGSDDGTKEYLDSISSYISYWVSEPDNGIYHAMNKGTRIATGEYCLYLNSGDLLYDGFVTHNFLLNKINADIIAGICQYGINEIERITRPKEYVDMSRLVGYVDSINELSSNSLSHQSTFIRRQLLINHPYDEKYRISSDYKMWLDLLILNNASYATVDFFVSKFDMEGISNQSNKNSMESAAILKELIPQRILNDYIKYAKIRYLLSYKLFKRIVKIEIYIRNLFK